jgi:hypothetical protein
LYTCILVCFWTFDGLKIVLMRPVIFKNFKILTLYPSLLQLTMSTQGS